MNKSQKKNETGRSMVEMLGVLAVMGVLSVAGIAGYNNAMNRHRANELLNEASKRAVVVAGQVTMGGRTPSLSEFTNPTGYTFDVKGPDGTKAWASGDNQFTITVSGVSEAVCNHMQNMKTALIQKFEPTDCATTATVKLTYNADLSVGSSSDPSGGQEEITPTCDPECTGGKECVNGTCQCPDDKPIWNGTVCVAKATCTTSQWYNPKTNGCETRVICPNDPDGVYIYYSPELNKCAEYCNGVVDENDNCTCSSGQIYDWHSIGEFSCCNDSVVTDLSGHLYGCCPNNKKLVFIYDDFIELCCESGKYTYKDGDAICFKECEENEEEYSLDDRYSYERYCCPEDKTVSCENYSDGMCKKYVCE